jgi:transposase
MSKQAPKVELSLEERTALERMSRSGTCEQRLAFRAKIILQAAERRENVDIAQKLGSYPATISKWRRRFVQHRLRGLSDAPRPGVAPIYDQTTELRVLTVIDLDPPQGYTTWDGPLVAQALGDVSVHQVWRILRKHKISLARRRSWCVSTDPEFAAKAADIVGLYLNPPQNAVVLSVDEKPCIQALERQQGYLKLPNGRALTGYSHEYKRHGTLTLIAALNVATGQVKAKDYKQHRRIEFLDFLDELVAAYPEQELHVIVDNLKTHDIEATPWKLQHPNVFIHFTPTHASWLNQIEIWFSILWRKCLRGANSPSARHLRDAIRAFIQVFNQAATPFVWTATKVYPKKLNKYANLCK